MRRSDDPELLEALAALEHERWAGWMRYLFSKCPMVPGGLLIAAAYAAVLYHQMDTPYADLSEAEKEADRGEAQKMLGLLGEFTEKGKP